VIALILGMTYAQISQAILTGGGSIWTRQLIPAAQVNTLQSIPVTMVAAPGAGLTVQPIYASTEQLTGAAIYSVAPAMRGRWTGLAVDNIPIDTVVNTPTTRQQWLERIDDGSVGTGNNVTGAAYEFTATADTTLGSGHVSALIGYCITGGL